MQEHSANIILGEPGETFRFTLHYGLIKLKMQIKPITAGQMIAISKEISKIGSFDAEKEMFPALMENVEDLRHIAAAITIATGARFPGIVRRAIMDLPLKDIETLFKMVHKQADPQPFFFTMVLAKGRMNILSPKKEPPSEVTQSSGVSQ
jgi:hypothetical protein